MHLLTLPFALTGRLFISLLNELGGLCIFAFLGLWRALKPPFEWQKISQQIYLIGINSLPVIILVAMFTGMVLGLQGYYSLKKFGSEGMLGSAVALSLIRELGPVMTAIMVVGQAGSAMAAELADMRNSEQVDALRSMAIDPIRYLITPRLVGALISIPLLCALFNVIGIFGGYLTAVLLLDLDAGTYWKSVENSIESIDILMTFNKALIFSLFTTSLCCYQGYFIHTRKKGHGSQGISYATTSAVVLSSITILITDYLITSFYI